MFFVFSADDIFIVKNLRISIKIFNIALKHRSIAIFAK